MNLLKKPPAPAPAAATPPAPEPNTFPALEKPPIPLVTNLAAISNSKPRPVPVCATLRPIDARYASNL